MGARDVEDDGQLLAALGLSGAIDHGDHLVVAAAANAGHLGNNGEIPDVKELRIPVKYLANLLTAGDTQPVIRALERMLAVS